jgi:hypothetical protein
VGVTDYRTIATRLLIAFVIPLALTGCLSGEDENQEVKKIAEKVKRQAELSEKAEGSQDLVKDKVTVTKGEKGQPIIEQFGEASSYGQGFHDKKTSTGEKFDQNDRTAAHPTLPMGTQTTVTNLKTGNSVDVTINDRGPYVKGRDKQGEEIAGTGRSMPPHVFPSEYLSAVALASCSPLTTRLAFLLAMWTKECYARPHGRGW